MVTVFSKSNLIANRSSLFMIKKNLPQFKCPPLQTIKMMNLMHSNSKRQKKFMINMTILKAITKPQQSRKLLTKKSKKR